MKKKHTKPSKPRIEFSFVTVKHEVQSNEGITINHVAQPIVILDHMTKLFGVGKKTMLKKLEHTINHVTSLIMEFVCVSEAINEVKKINFAWLRSIKEILHCKNRKGYWMTVVFIRSLWQIPKNSESPDTRTQFFDYQTQLRFWQIMKRHCVPYLKAIFLKIRQ